MFSKWVWKYILCSIVLFVLNVRGDEDIDDNLTELQARRRDVDLSESSTETDNIAVKRLDEDDNLKMIEDKIANDIDLASVSRRGYDTSVSNSDLNEMAKRNEDSDDDETNKDKESRKTRNNEDKKHKKRLETIDGVEIASSYREYIDLGVGDLEDRLKKHEFQSDYYKKLMLTRKKLYEQIDTEIARRRRNAAELREKDKRLVDRLSQNTKMKEALTQLASIAGLKLHGKRSDAKAIEFDEFTNVDNENATLIANSLINSNTFLNNVKNAVITDKTNNSYNQYIEMAYAEVNTVLASDKQTLIEVIRQIKDNDKRLKMLGTLKIKVENSLTRFEATQNKLNDLIKHEKTILEDLLQLKEIMKQHGNKFLNLVVPKTGQAQAVTSSTDTVTVQSKVDNSINPQNDQTDQ